MNFWDNTSFPIAGKPEHGIAKLRRAEIGFNVESAYAPRAVASSA